MRYTAKGATPGRGLLQGTLAIREKGTDPIAQGAVSQTLNLISTSICAPADSLRRSRAKRRSTSRRRSPAQTIRTSQRALPISRSCTG